MRLSRNKALFLSLLIVGAAACYRYFSNQALPPSGVSVNTPPVLGPLGSEHSHQSIMMIVNGATIDLYQPKYIERSEYVHLHADDIGGYFIHKHATGATLAYLLSSLGMRLTKDCLTLDTGANYCANATNTLSLYINRSPYTESLEYYELADGDKILIDYGTTSPMQLMLEANGVPDIPADLSDLKQGS